MMSTNRGQIFFHLDFFFFFPLEFLFNYCTGGGGQKNSLEFLFKQLFFIFSVVSISSFIFICIHATSFFRPAWV